jgi:hypothetical protein
VLSSPNVVDSNGEQANLVNVIHEVAMAIQELAAAVRELRPSPAAPPLPMQRK